MADQPYWAGRVAELGIGAAHDGPTPTTESLSAALRTALSPETRARASRRGRHDPHRRGDGGREAAARLGQPRKATIACMNTRSEHRGRDDLVKQNLHLRHPSIVEGFGLRRLPVLVSPDRATTEFGRQFFPVALVHGTRLFE